MGSTCCSHSIASGVTRPFKVSMCLAHDRTGMAHHRIRRSDDLNVVSSRSEVLVEFGRKSFFKLECGAVLTPGSSQQPAGPRHGFTQLHVVTRHTRPNGCLCLRLAFAAHGSVHHGAAVIETAHCRVQRVKGLPARLESIPTRRGQPKAGASILPSYSRSRQYQAGAELKIGRLDARDHAAIPIGDPKPDRVAFLRRIRPRERAVGVDT